MVYRVQRPSERRLLRHCASSTQRDPMRPLPNADCADDDVAMQQEHALRCCCVSPVHSQVHSALHRMTVLCASATITLVGPIHRLCYLRRRRLTPFIVQGIACSASDASVATEL